jgi:hypothetical protein
VVMVITDPYSGRIERSNTYQMSLSNASYSNRTRPIPFDSTGARG